MIEVYKTRSCAKFRAYDHKKRLVEISSRYYTKISFLRALNQAINKYSVTEIKIKN